MATPIYKCDSMDLTPSNAESTELMDLHLFGYLKPCNTDAQGLVRLDLFKLQPHYDIGRCPESNTIVFSGLKVSNKHCEIIWNGDERDGFSVTVHDHSSNGTWINRKQIGKENSAPLEDGDEICFGSCVPQPQKNGIEDYRYIFFQNPEVGIESCYQKMEHLGKGGFGSVIRVVHRESLKSYALKRIGVESGWHTEIRNMKMLSHPNVCKLINYFYNLDGGNPTVDLLLEYVDGGNLFNRIFGHGYGRPFSEDGAGEIAIQIQNGMMYIHSQGIVHRDLKSENILLSLAFPTVAKIADFGFSKDVGLESEALKKSDEVSWVRMLSYCGTRSCCAPEILLRKPYTHLVDTWSMGVIVYEMLTGYFLFSDKDNDIPSRKLGRNHHYQLSRWNTSKEAQDFVYGCLTENTDKRPSIKDLALNPWISRFQGSLPPEMVFAEINHPHPVKENTRLSHITEEDDDIEEDVAEEEIID